MIRPAAVALVFGLCSSVVFAALAWTSLLLLRFDAAQRSAQNEAALEENVRLALWRIDSALAGLILQESVRPVFEYWPVYYIGRDGLSLAPGRGSKAVLSPLASAKVPYVIAHLQVNSDKRVTSPQFRAEAPNEPERAQPTPGAADEKLHQQVQEVGTAAIAVGLAAQVPPPAVSLDSANTFAVMNTANPPAIAQTQASRGAQEFLRRSEYVQNNSVLGQNSSPIAPAEGGASGLVGGAMTPFVLDGAQPSSTHPARQRLPHRVGQEADENVRPHAIFFVVPDGADQQLLFERTGRMPKSVTVVIGHDTVVITLHEALSPAERGAGASPDGASQGAGASSAAFR